MSFSRDDVGGLTNKVVALADGALTLRAMQRGDRGVAFADAERARSWLRARATAPGTIGALRRALGQLSDGPEPATRSDADVIDRVARALVHRRLAAVVANEALASGPSLEVLDQPPPVAAALAWIEVAVVWDEDDAPVGGVELTFGLSNGEARTARTSSNGHARIDGIPDGACRVTAGGVAGLRRPSTLHVAGTGEAPIGEKPTEAALARSRELRPKGALRLARVEPHRVRTGESLATIAKAAGLTWQALAEFNWGTASPKKINERLRAEVGCTKRTHDKKNYLLDDGDHPGLLFVPHAWQGGTFATRDTHTIRVLQRRFVYVLYDQHRRFPLPFHEYLLYDGEDHVATGESDEEGRVMLDSVPAHWHIEVIGPGPSHGLWAEKGDGDAADDPPDHAVAHEDDGLEEAFDPVPLTSMMEES